MKKNKLRAGLNSEKKLKDSFYYFIVDNRIDWAIILGSIFCILPYLGSQAWQFILIKSIIVILIILVSLRYLKTWNALRGLDLELETAFSKIKGGISQKKIEVDALGDFQKELGERFALLTKEYEEKSDQYDSLSDYLKSEQSGPKQIDELLNRDKDVSLSALNLFLGVMLALNKVQVVPRLRLLNYYKLLTIFALTIAFFLVYTVENSL